MRLGEQGRPVDGRFAAGDHGLRRLIVVGKLTDLALGRLGRQLLGHLLADAQQCRHGAMAERHGGLHGLAAQLQEPGGVAERQSPGGRQGGIFAERVAGDILDAIDQPEALLELQHPYHGQRRRHQGGLRILRQRQLLKRPRKHQFRELLAKRGVNLGKHVAGRSVGLCQLGAHADDLTALPGENECNCHARLRIAAALPGFTTLPTRRQGCAHARPCRLQKLRYNGAHPAPVGG